MFLTEKAPYLLTIVFLALGWTISQVSTDLAKSPIIEYKSCKKDNTNGSENIFTITNISSEKLFTDLKFTLRIAGTTNSKCIGVPKMMIPPPTDLKGLYQGGGATQPTCIDDKHAEYIIPQLHPGASLQLVMKTDKNTDVNIYIWCKEAVRLVESSITTFIIKHRLNILLWTIVIWTLLIIAYFIIILNSNTEPQHGNERESQPE